MSTPDRATLKQLANDIAALLEEEPVDRMARDWFAPYQAICDRLKSDPLLFGLEIEEHVWHWLSDADVRAKDKDYAQVQNDLIKAILDEWRD